MGHWLYSPDCQKKGLYNQRGLRAQRVRNAFISLEDNRFPHACRLLILLFRKIRGAENVQRRLFCITSA